MKYDDVLLYKLVRPLFKILIFFMRPKVTGLDNIPSDGGVVLAGTHTNNLDSVLLISVVKREVHFLAKIELWSSKIRFFVKRMGLIPVDRVNKSTDALGEAEKYLSNNKVIGIFPEGTTEKGRGLLPFKTGAVRMAYDTDSVIVPFIIKGKYKLFSKDLSIEFLEGYKIKSKDIDKENDKLRNKIKDILDGDK